MAYATKYYDYQIAIVFAILLGGLLLLALVITAIYYICVVNMRGKKGGITRVPSGRSTVKTMVEPPLQYTTSVQPEILQQYSQYLPYSGTAAEGMINQQAQPQHQSLVDEYQQQQQQLSGARMREIEQGYFQQQGPVSYTTAYPYEQQQSHQQQAHIVPASYQMSSV